MKRIRYFSFGIGYLVLLTLFAGFGYLFYFMFTKSNSIAIVLLAFYLLNVVFAFALFIQKRHIGAKVSWFMVMTALPVLGHIIFLVFGRRYRGRQSIMRYREQPMFQLEHGIKINDDVLSAVSHLSGRGIYHGNTDLYASGEEGYEALFNDIAKAQNFIHMQYYIIKPGEIYEHFKSLLIQKAREGVEVKLIIDDFGRWAMPWYEVKNLRHHGIAVGIFGQVNFPFIDASNGYRTHRKAAIIDGQVVHTGGINIANEYASINPFYGVWVDYQVRLDGMVVRSFQLVFMQDWKRVTGEDLDSTKYLLPSSTLSKTQGKSLLTLIESSPEIEEPLLQDTILALIAKARKSISIVTPYLVPTPEIEAAVRTAVLSGVKVKIYIPGRPDKKSVFVATRLFARRLIGYGVEVYEQSHMLLHSKFGVFDDEYAYFGTANIDMRSVYSQFELTVVAKGQIVVDLNHLFKQYELSSRLLEVSDFRSGIIRSKMSRLYVIIFSPIM